MDFECIFKSELSKYNKECKEVSGAEPVILIDKIEDVYRNPQDYLDSSCVNLFNLLVSKNIYPYMIGNDFIALMYDSLSLNNRMLLTEINLDSYNVTMEEDNRLIISGNMEYLVCLGNMFRIQDVPYGVGYISVLEFLMNYCGCYKYKEKPDCDFSFDELISKYGIDGYCAIRKSCIEAFNSDNYIREFDPYKMEKTVSSYASSYGMYASLDRVYMSKFHYYNYMRYKNSLDDAKSDGFTLCKKYDI